MRRRSGACALAIVSLGAALASSAAAQTYAPVDRPGPPLSVPQSQLDAALECGGGLAGAATEPVLLVPGTTVTPEKNFSWNWIPALNAIGRPWCTVELPGSAMADIQVAGEYVVNAIRTMHDEADREVDVLGHSQGGMVPRWALRFWPDTRAMVDDQVGMAPSNHGTDVAVPICAVPGGCAPAFWQQRTGSAFIRALNSRQETFDGIDYTAIYTITDTVVMPNLNDNGSSALRPGGGGAITNVAIQDVCPTDLTEHLTMGTISNTTYRLVMDALDNPGPADPSRVPRAGCLSPLMPGLNPATLALDLADAAAFLATTIATYPHVPAEPPLACYVTASCGEGGSAAGPSPQAEPALKCSKKKSSKRKKSSKKKSSKRKKPKQKMRCGKRKRKRR